MYVCERCLIAIENHEGEQPHKRATDIPEVLIYYGFYNDNGDFEETDDLNKQEEHIKCEFCEEMIPVSEAIEIM